MTIGTLPAEAFAQSLRMRLRKLGKDHPLLIVEGSSDKSALMKWLGPSVHVIPAAGKEQVVLSRAHLSVHERSRCTMLIDCDGAVDKSWLGEGDLVISELRDLEADLIARFSAVESLVFERGSQLGESKEQLVAVARKLEKFATDLATIFGVVKDTARTLGIGTRIEDPVTGDKRRLALTDIKSKFWAGGWPQAPSLEMMTGLVALRLSWTEDQPQAILRQESLQRLKACRSHLVASCESCTSRRFANGHDLVDALAMGLHALGIEVDAAVVAKDLRLASAPTPDSDWKVLERLRRRQAETGLTWLAV